MAQKRYDKEYKVQAIKLAKEGILDLGIGTHS